MPVPIRPAPTLPLWERLGARAEHHRAAAPQGTEAQPSHPALPLDSELGLGFVLWGIWYRFLNNIVRSVFICLLSLELLHLYFFLKALYLNPR